MLCRNCGSEMEEEKKFCPVCGAPTSLTEETAGEENAVDKTTTVGDPASIPVEGQKAGKGGKKGLKALIIAGAIIVILGVLFAIFSANVIEFFKRTFRSNESYMRLKITEEADKKLDDLPDMMRKRRDDSKKKTGFDVGCSLEFSSEADLVLKMMGIELSDVSFSASFDKAENERGVSFDLKTGESSFGGAIAKKDGKLYVSLPSLIETVLEYSLKSGKEDPGKEADPEKLAEILKKYVEIAVECVKKAEKTSVSLEIDGIKENAYLYKTEIPPEDLKETLNKLTDMLKNDGDIKALAEKAGIDFDSLKEKLDGLSGELEFDLSLSLGIWVNSKGDVLGVSLGYLSGEKTGFELSSVRLCDGSDSAFEVRLSSVNKEGAEELAVISGKTLDNDGVKEGKYTLETDFRRLLLALAEFVKMPAEIGLPEESGLCEILSVETENMKYDGDSGNCSGEITFSLSDGGVEALNKVFRLETLLAKYLPSSIKPNTVLSYLSAFSAKAVFSKDGNDFETKLSIDLGGLRICETDIGVKGREFREVAVPEGEKTKAENVADAIKWLLTSPALQQLISSSQTN